MIKQEPVTINGLSLVRTYSDADMKIHKVGTDTVSKSEIVLLQTEVNELKAVLRTFKLLTEV